MKFLFSLLCFLSVILCNAQTVTFIGQLGFGSKKKIVDPYKQGSPQFDFFNDNFEIKCMWHNSAITVPISGYAARKETYFKGTWLGTFVEIRIQTSASFLKSLVSPPLVDIWAYSKKRGVPNQPIPPFYITLNLEDAKNKINDNTYKIEEIIGLSSPEELTIPMIIDYIKNRLYGDSTHSQNFLNTIIDLDRFYEKRSFESFLQYDQLIKFYDLLHFIEPFVDENSFLNEEGRKLNFRLSQISDTLLSKQLFPKMNEELTNEYIFGKNVYREYQDFYAKINAYYKQIQAILFLRTPSQIEEYRNNRLVPIRTDTTKVGKLEFTIGTGITYGLNKIYNVTTTPPSDSSRVQFQDISRLNTILSAGLVWSPFSRKNTNDSSNKGNNVNNKYRRSNFSLGLFLDYYLYPSQTQVSSNSPVGLGLGVGYSLNNFGILGKISFNELRYPRQFFIDSFRNRNRPLGPYGNSVNINDNSLFFDKTNISLGLSVVYTISSRRRKDEGN